MKRHIPVASALALALGLTAQSFAQSSQPERDQSFTHGESKRCETLSGDAKKQCDREEATKTQEPGSSEDAKASREAPASSGSSGQDSSSSGAASSGGEPRNLAPD